MIKRIVIVAVTATGLLLAASKLSGITPAWVINGPAVATGIGAKLLCSAEYVMGSEREQAWNDMVQYSPILEQLTVNYDYANRTVSATFWGLNERTARYLPGLGCAVDHDNADARLALVTDIQNLQPPVSVNTASSAAIQVSESGASTNPAGANPSALEDLVWPAGNRVNTIQPDMQNLLDDIVAVDNQAGLNTRALLVVNDGQIVAESYAQGAGPETPLLGWSMAKSLTAVMLGNLEYRGLLDPTRAPVFKAWAGDERANISLTHLLTMTDGLAFEEFYQPGDDSTRMLFMSQSASDYAMTRPAAHSPGQRFQYSSGTANLLARLYTDVLGTPQQAYDDFMQEMYRPMAFQHAVLEMDASAHFVGSSYFYASARDWARLGQLMLNGGTLNGKRLLSEDWGQRATTPNSSDNERAYGYQWWLNAGDEWLRFADLPEDAFFANGNREQTTMVFPSHNTVIVRLGWTAGQYPVNRNFRTILDALASPEGPDVITPDA